MRPSARTWIVFVRETISGSCEMSTIVHPYSGLKSSSRIASLSFSSTPVKPLVEDQQLRAVDDRAGNHNPLHLATREITTLR
jgi:hypothetical protein